MVPRSTSPATTEAPTTAAPEGSVTLPVIVAVTSCPDAGSTPRDAANRTMKTAGRSSDDSFSRIIFFLLQSTHDDPSPSYAGGQLTAVGFRHCSYRQLMVRRVVLQIACLNNSMRFCQAGLDARRRGNRYSRMSMTCRR